jgi:hypothetical protein
MPGQAFDPQAPQEHREDRTYEILRQLDARKQDTDTNTLAGLDDVSIPAPLDGQVLTFVTADNEWEAQSVTSGDSTHTGTEASRPAASNDGDLFLPSDGATIQRDTGAAWSPWGPIWPFTEPVDASYSWDNQGTASVDTTRGGIILSDVGGDSSTKGRFRYKTAPGTPYTITAFMLHNCLSSKQYPQAGVFFRESATGKIITMHQTAGNIFWTRWTNSGAVFADYTSLGYAAALNWMRMTYDGTNLHFLHSADGVNWVDHLGAKAKADFFTSAPNQVGYFVESLNLGVPNHAVAAWLLHWKET